MVLKWLINILHIDLFNNAYTSVVLVFIVICYLSKMDYSHKELQRAIEEQKISSSLSNYKTVAKYHMLPDPIHRRSANSTLMSVHWVSPSEQYIDRKTTEHTNTNSILCIGQTAIKRSSFTCVIILYNFYKP